MHNILFGAKRLHLTAQRRMGEALAVFGLTPARFDILQILVTCGRMKQSELRRKLGVARSTVSRMLIAMERRGLIVRDSNAPQRAQKWIRVADLTAHFYWRLLALARPAVSAGIACAFQIPAHAFARFVTFVFLATDFIAGARALIGDRATLIEPYWDYHPDN